MVLKVEDGGRPTYKSHSASFFNETSSSFSPITLSKNCKRGIICSIGLPLSRPRQSNHESGWIFLFYSDKSKDLGAIKRKKGTRRSLDWIVLSNNPIFRITAKVILPPRLFKLPNFG